MAPPLELSPVRSGLVAAIGICMIALLGCMQKRPGDIWLSSVPIEADGDAFAVKRLSKELSAGKEPRVVRIYWSLNGKGPARRVIYYDRDKKQAGYEDDPGSGPSRIWRNVDEDTIHSLAAKSRSFEDLRSPDEGDRR